jgi:hypothetical protein
MLRRFVVAAVAIGLCTTSLHAAKIKVWHPATPAHYEKAQFKGIVISNEGALRLSRDVKPLLGLDATHAWSIVEDKAGNLYAATGDEGKLYRVTADGKVSVVFESQDSQVLSLALALDGSRWTARSMRGRAPEARSSASVPMGAGESSSRPANRTSGVSPWTP